MNLPDFWQPAMSLDPKYEPFQSISWLMLADGGREPVYQTIWTDMSKEAVDTRRKQCGLPPLQT